MFRIRSIGRLLPLLDLVSDFVILSIYFPLFFDTTDALMKGAKLFTGLLLIVHVRDSFLFIWWSMLGG